MHPRVGRSARIRSRATNRLIAILSIFVFASACDSTGPKVQPGTMRAHLLSANGGDGAAVVELPAEGVRSVRAVPDRVLPRQVGDKWLVAVISAEAAELSFEVDVDDVRSPPHATVLEVADAQNQLRPGVSGYQVVFRR